MIGTVTMDISDAEARAAFQYYFNSDLFCYDRHKTKVTKVHQRSTGRFVVEFEGKVEPQRVVASGSDEG